MSKEIKFRAWALNKDKNCQGWCFYDNADCMKYINDRRVEITQFTGLKDKNGKEIFEGDIVEYIERLPVFPEKRIAVVQFIGGNVDYANNFLISPFVNIGSFNYETNCITGVMNNPAESVIIGNIYQNPELLGGENE
jgi:uncharacterized phage protein (TIGR01671 family)